MNEPQTCEGSESALTRLLGMGWGDESLSRMDVFKPAWSFDSPLTKRF